MKFFRVTAIAQLLAVVSSTLGAQQTANDRPTFRNEALGFQAPAFDIVQHRTLEENVRQTKDVAPTMDRLGTSAYPCSNGAPRTLRFTIDTKPVAYWNASTHPWVVENKPD